MKAIQNSVRAFCAIFWLFLVASPAMAAPVTVRFDIEVDNVIVQGSPSNTSPLNAGDQIQGQFTFNPLVVVPVPPAGIQVATQVTEPFPLLLAFNNATISSNSYDIESRDNFPVIDGSGTTDALFVDNPSWIASPELNALGFRPAASSLRFTSFSNDILHGANIPADVDTWNIFERRRFSLFLIDNENQGAVLVFGSIGDLAQVPEPSGIVVCFVLGLSVGICYFGKISTHPRQP